MTTAINRIGVFSIVVLCLLGPGMAQAQSTGAAEEEVIEEIRVYGQKSLMVLRHELEIAQEKLLDTYNDLNANDTLDIVCVNSAPTGSKIVRRTCLPQYRWDELRNDSADFLRNSGMAPPAEMITVMPNDDELLENMQSLARQHPQLLESLMEYQGKLSEVRTERQRRRAKESE